MDSNQNAETPTRLFERFEEASTRCRYSIGATLIGLMVLLGSAGVEKENLHDYEHHDKDSFEMAVRSGASFAGLIGGLMLLTIGGISTVRSAKQAEDYRDAMKKTLREGERPAAPKPLVRP